MSSNYLKEYLSLHIYFHQTKLLPILFNMIFQMTLKFLDVTSANNNHVTSS